MKKNILYILALCFFLFCFGVAMLDENWFVAALSLVAIVAALVYQRQLTSY